MVRRFKFRSPFILILAASLWLVAGCQPVSPVSGTPAPGTEEVTSTAAITATTEITATGEVMPAEEMTPTAGSAMGVFQLPEGFQIEKVAEGLTYATSATWDDQGQLYVAEAGGAFLEAPVPARIMRIENGQAIEVVDLTDKGVSASVVGLTWHEGAFYITHRDPEDRTGAVSRVELDGTVTRVLSGIRDSQSEHQINDIKVGPDGRMYVAVGPATNAGVVGIDLGPFVSRSPEVHTTPCEDIVLTGRNFQTPDFRTEDPSDLATTGAFVPFGTETTPGQVITGMTKCGGSILVFEPDDAEATLEVYAWGFRNIIGLAWDENGEMYAAVNGYDIRGSRSVRDEFDPTYRVREGAWYGWPDFSAALEPVTEPKFDVPQNLKAPVFVNGEPQEGNIGFLIDHEASGLQPPDSSLVFGLHEVDSSPSMLAVAPASWGDLAGQVFVAEWGDLAPATNPLLPGPTGYRISRIDPASTTMQAVPFVSNVQPGSASSQGAMGMGLERPFDVKFGPDGAMYIVDYGVARVNPANVAQGGTPYEFPPETGTIWRVTRTDQVMATTEMTPTAENMPTTTTAQSDMNVVEAIQANDNLQQLAAALETAGLIDALQGEGPFTIFAPTDEAFATLPAATQEDPEALVPVLQRHVVVDRISAAELAELGTALTLLGNPLAITTTGDGTFMVEGASIISADIPAINGVIHVIDSVLLPPAP